MNNMAVSLLLVTLLVAGTRAQQHVEVDTPLGRVKGNIVNLVNQPNSQVRSFLGLRYGLPPVGDLRFAPTQPVTAWPGLLDATRQEAACHGGLGPLHPDWDLYSEDCLRMNIHTPHDSQGQAPYPVMIYFHGGAYRSGGNVMYPGHFMAARDVIVVVANYRLGALGFANTGDDVAKGNYALWDQRQAMIFVRDNIASFGGDPTRVTLFGQSAGASSIGLQIVSPQTTGLFHRAIMMSGSDLAPWSFNPTDLPPEDYTKEVAAALNCSTADSQVMIDCLRTRDAAEIANIRETVIDGWISQGFAPVPDGPGGFLPEDPYTLRNNGTFVTNIDVMAGHTSGDGSTYLLPFVPEAVDGGWNRSMHEFYIRERMVNWVMARETPDRQAEMAAAIQFYYTDWPNDEDPDKNRFKLREAVTDVGFGAAQNVVLKLHAEHRPVYEYVFGFMGNPHSILIPEWMDCIHGLSDIPFVWGFPMVPDNREVEDEAQLDLLSIFPWTDADKAYANYILDLFANFAKTGNPTSTPVQVPGGGNLNWDAFTLDNMNYIWFGNNDTSIHQNRLAKNNAFWTEYAYWIVTRNSTQSLNEWSPKFDSVRDFEADFYSPHRWSGIV